ncbi:ABC transporter permease [Fulvivirga sp. 29W222]|uniref:ABC transporter permease n=1 Tax=Fulvivirga marina TaxID=2494733 RepID=A0A937KE65_9BACT|nr:FtsX-like permease family protein [Fulvivirga marina]MBL6449239.1 ABC transporter permease [Fulvivirga marina]
MLIQLAWRNVWRNKRRTVITLSSIFFAVLLALFMRSMQLGSYENMIRNSVEFYSGYIQIHKTGYWEDKSINKMMVESDSLKATILNAPNVEFYIPRLESFVLAASDEISKGIVVVGTAPKKENRMTKLADRVQEGSYFKSDTRGVMVAEGLANYLELGLGDTLVMIGQGYHGVNAVDQYPITAILKFPNPQANDNMVYMPIELAREFNSALGLSTALVLSVDDIDQIKNTKQHLISKLGSEYEVMDWTEMQPELVQLIQSDNAGGIIMLGILYLVIAFGIFGTIMMMSMERNREFGVLVAVGMRRRKLSLLVTLETFIIGVLGLKVSLVAGILLLLYMHYHPIPLTGNAAEAMLKMGIEPIMPFSLDPMIFISQMLAILVIVLVCLAYPLTKIMNLKAIAALKH